MDGPTPNLTWQELASHDGVPYPAEWRETRAIILGIEFEKIREECGNRPITIASGYRTWAWNVRVGGGRKSQHPEARAVDMLTPAGLTVVEFSVVVVGVAKWRQVIRGVGIYRWGVHMDTRPAERLAHWIGTKVAPEVMSA